MRSADEVDAHVGRRLRRRRLSLGISQEQLGAALGLTFQQVQKYEKGQNRIGAGRLFRIANILSVPVQFFFEGLPDGQDAGSENGDDKGDGAGALALTPEGQALSAGFFRIADPAIRRSLLELIRCLGGAGHRSGAD